VLANQNAKLTGPDQGFLVSRLVLTLKPWERGCFKSSPGSWEFDVLSLPCGGAFDKGGEFEPEVLKFCPFSGASCMHRKDFALAANTDISDFEENGLNFVKNWLKEMGMEKLCASFEGMYYKIV
jgi:hypothetical protein